jgi:hypothetical protein
MSVIEGKAELPVEHPDLGVGPKADVRLGQHETVCQR